MYIYAIYTIQVLYINAVFLQIVSRYCNWITINIDTILATYMVDKYLPTKKQKKYINLNVFSLAV